MDSPESARAGRRDRSIAQPGDASPQITSAASPRPSRSGNQTPLTSASSPAHPPPPPPLWSPSEPSDSSSLQGVKNIKKTLQGFSHSLTSLATWNVKREMIKTRSDKHDRELNKWRPQHENFVSLAEDQDRDSVKIKRDSATIEEKVKRQKESQSNAIEAMAVAMVAVNNGSVLSKSNDGTGQFEADVKDIKAEMPAMRMQFQKFKADAHDIKANQSSLMTRIHRDYATKDMFFKLESGIENQHGSKQDLKEIENHFASKQDLGEIENRLVSKQAQGLREIENQLENQFVSNQRGFETHIANISVEAKKAIANNPEYEQIKKRVGELEEKRSATTNIELDQIQKRIGDLEKKCSELNNSTVEVDSLKEQLGQLRDDFSDQESRLQSLQTEVTGDESENPGFLDLVQKQEDALANLKSNLIKIDQELSEFVEDSEKYDTRIASLESSREHQAMNGMAQSSTSELVPRVDALEVELGRLRSEQEQKDTIVTEEVERLDSSLKELQTQIGGIRDECNSSLEKVQTQLQTFSSLNASLTPQLVPTANGNTNHQAQSITLAQDHPISQSINDGKLHETLKSHKSALEEHRDKLAAYEAFIFTLQKRFDNLTTDQLARNMVDQMKQIYPDVANAQVGIDSLRDRHASLAQDISVLREKVTSINDKGSIFNNKLHEDQNSEIRRQISALSEEVTRTLESAMDTLKRHDQAQATRLHDLLDKVSTLDMSASSKKEIEKIESLVGDLKDRVEGDEKISTLLKTDIDRIESRVKDLTDQVEINEDHSSDEIIELTQKHIRLSQDIQDIKQRLNIVEVGDSQEDPTALDSAEPNVTADVVPEKNLTPAVQPENAAAPAQKPEVKKAFLKKKKDKPTPKRKKVGHSSGSEREGSQRAKKRGREMAGSSD
ncbi:hypothetical protein MMC20_005814 [Loxospora ochrophaea]|nr:hypothetical protein [Loxospora ochrophaea]